MSRCIDTPVSWWTLERYTIGEVTVEERAAVQGHLDTCPHCRIRLHSIETDHRPLPKLSVTAEAAAARRPWLDPSRWRTVAAVGAAAAIVALLVLPNLREDQTSPRRPGNVAERGGAPALVLVREREGVVEENPRRYTSGDRFRLELTLSGNEPHRVEAVVFQGDEVYFPSDDVALVAPGNRNILPGVFRVTGTAPVTICVVIGPDLPDRARLMSEGPEALPDEAICRTLTARTPEE